MRLSYAFVAQAFRPALSSFVAQVFRPARGARIKFVHYGTFFNSIEPGGIGSATGSTEPFTGGKSWNMKSHFQRSDGFDACSQCWAAVGRPKASW